MTQEAKDSYGGDGLIQFLDYTVQKGLLNPNTANARKFAVQKILSAIDSHESQDLRSIDRNLVYQRFVNKMGRDFTPGSLTAYRSRFNRALDDFLRWKEDPSAFKPGLSQRNTRSISNGEGEQGKQKKKTAKSARQPVETKPAVDFSHHAPVVFPIPLRPGLVVLIHHLPSDLSADEARKICAVVTALAAT